MAEGLQHRAAPRQPRPGAAAHVLAEGHQPPGVHFRTVYLTGKLTAWGGRIRASQQIVDLEFRQTLGDILETGKIDEAKLFVSKGNWWRLRDSNPEGPVFPNPVMAYDFLG